jgi:hypothetical protein
MFTMLLANAEGRAYLTDSKLLKEIAANLEALDQVMSVQYEVTDLLSIQGFRIPNYSFPNRPWRIQ